MKGEQVKLLALSTSVGDTEGWSASHSGQLNLWRRNLAAIIG
jgi:hypothetical protein